MDDCGRLRRACLRQVLFIPIPGRPLQQSQEQAPAVQNNLALAHAGEVLLALELHFSQYQKLCERRLKSAVGVAEWRGGRALGSVNPLALAAIGTQVHRIFCGDYGIYLPTGWLAAFQVGPSQSATERLPPLSGRVDNLQVRCHLT